MPTGLESGAFAHVAGTFDLESVAGTIDYVTPVDQAITSSDGDQDIRLVGEDEGGTKQFDMPIEPQRNSCAPNGQRGTYEAYVPIAPSLSKLKLVIKGTVAAVFSRGQPVALGAISMGAPSPDKGNQIPIQVTGAARAAGVTYSIQAKPSGTNVWQTLAVGLSTPETKVDINQFPGASTVDVRVLQSDGFSDSESSISSKASPKKGDRASVGREAVVAVCANCHQPFDAVDLSFTREFEGSK